MYFLKKLHKKRALSHIFPYIRIGELIMIEPLHCVVVLFISMIKEGDSFMLRDRVERFLNEFGMPITVFCKKIEISPGYFYKWKVGKVNFSEETLQRISNYLSKYGF